MRNTSTLVGLTLFALAGTASAQEAAPAAASPAAETSAPAPAKAAPSAGEVAAAPTPMPPVAAERKLELGLSFLPMAMGTFKYSDSLTTTVSTDAYFAYGLGLSAGYKVYRGLIVGLAPQAIVGVQGKPTDTATYVSAREYDILARVAYELQLVDTIAVYAEVLPGYSVIMPSDGSAAAKGMVFAGGAGVIMSMGERAFINIGGGYQVGYQSQTQGINQWQYRTKYIRGVIGGGMHF